MSRRILINSFWGIDPAAALPPNMTLTGPLAKPKSVDPKENEENLLKKDKSCYDFMTKALKDKVPVLVITIGTEC